MNWITKKIKRWWVYKWIWGKEAKSYKPQVDKFIEKMFPTWPNWPVCNICELERARYDMFICDACEWAINRLKKK